jgi:hypothetical protein
MFGTRNCGCDARMPSRGKTWSGRPRGALALVEKTTVRA